MTRLKDMAYKHEFKQLEVMYVLGSVIDHPGLRPKYLHEVMKKDFEGDGGTICTLGQLVNTLYILLACQLVDTLEVNWEQSEMYKVWYPTENAEVWLKQVAQ